MKYVIQPVIASETDVTCVCCSLFFTVGISPLHIGTPVFPTGVCVTCCELIANAVIANRPLTGTIVAAPYPDHDGQEEELPPLLRPLLRSIPGQLATDQGTEQRPALAAVRNKPAQVCGKEVRGDLCAAEAGHGHDCMTHAEKAQLGALTALDAYGYWREVQHDAAHAERMLEAGKASWPKELAELQRRVVTGEVPVPGTPDWVGYYLNEQSRIRNVPMTDWPTTAEGDTTA